MKIDEGLYKAYLEEMNALENFRIAYASMHPGLPLDREDPDVRRLIEAMALFSARSRLAGARNISATGRRIFQQFFPYLLAPLPSMAMLQVVPTGQFVEPAFLPKGAEFILSLESGGGAIFQTTSDLRILPITLTQVGMLNLPQRGYRVFLRFSASFPRNEEIETLRLFINHLSNYESSQMVLFNLRRHLKRASVIFDEKPAATSSGNPCEISFGRSDDTEDFGHPLQRQREFFHFPWKETFLNFRIPKSSRNWSEFSILLDLGPGWPKKLMLNRDIFQLFTVPIVNLRKSMAQPILCDGTQERHPICHPDRDNGFDVHSVLGVYEVTPEGMAFVKPGILSGYAPSFETEEQRDSKGRKKQYLYLHFPKAFEKARTIAVEALWLQPWFSERISDGFKPTPFSRRMVGLKYELPVGPVPHAESLLQDTIEGFLHFLTLMNRETLGRDELLDVFQVIGIMRQKQFRELCELLADVRIEKSPLQNTRLTGVLKYRYLLRFHDYDPSREPMMEIFLEKLEIILNAWISGAKIEVQKENTESGSGSSLAKDEQ
jgi:type VI secretion system protein ImpG